MADRKSYEMKGENDRENEDRTNMKVIKVVAIIVAIIVIFIIGFVFGYFIRKPSTSKSECPRSSGSTGAPDKTEQHQMFKNGVSAENLEENMR